MIELLLLEPFMWGVVVGVALVFVGAPLSEYLKERRFKRQMKKLKVEFDK